MVEISIIEDTLHLAVQVWDIRHGFKVLGRQYFVEETLLWPKP